MPVDLIVYALVAAGLVLWLRSILGTRHGEERDRPNPYLAAPETQAPAVKDMRADTTESTPEQSIAELVHNPGGVMAIDSKTTESRLLEISAADKSFDARLFLEGAQDAFVYIVESFAQGDRETLKNLLAAPVYEAFERAITEREARSETQSTEIHAIRKAEIIDAAIRARTALITVRFRAEETSVTRDSDGAVIAGHPEKVTEMRDIWVFARPLKSRDPRWLLQETRGDFDGDNELVPDTHH